MQLDEVERVQGILERQARIDHASLIGIGVNAPRELPKLEDRWWAEIERPDIPAEAAVEKAQAVIDQLAYIERVNRRMRKRKVVH